MQKAQNMQQGARRMFPPWDSLTGLQNYQAWLSNVCLWAGVSFGILTAIVVFLIGNFQVAITNRIDALKQADDLQKEALRTADVAAARNETKELRDKMAPRVIPYEALQVLLTNLREVASPKSIDITVPVGNVEAIALGDQFCRIFADAGFEVNASQTVGIDPNVRGIVVAFDFRKQKPEYFDPMMAALDKSGLLLFVIDDPLAPRPQFRICHKPD